jgi:hypothetical protein
MPFYVFALKLKVIALVLVVSMLVVFIQDNIIVSLCVILDYILGYMAFYILAFVFIVIAPRACTIKGL